MVCSAPFGDQDYTSSSALLQFDEPSRNFLNDEPLYNGAHTNYGNLDSARGYKIPKYVPNASLFSARGRVRASGILVFENPSEAAGANNKSQVKEKTTYSVRNSLIFLKWQKCLNIAYLTIMFSGEARRSPVR